MAISLDSPSPAGIPRPISDCMRWCLTPANGDVSTAIGTSAYVEIQWPASPSVPANGTQFIIWGEVFEVQSGSAFTSNSFRVVSGNVAQTKQNFQDMIQSNYKFMVATNITYNGDGNNTMVINWIGCEPQENFSGAQMEFGDLESGVGMSTPVVFENGSVPDLVPGFQIVVTLLRYNPNNGSYSTVTEDDGYPIGTTCGFSSSVCVDFIKDVRQLLHTPLPNITDLSADAVGYLGMYQMFALRYGWVYRDENCQSLSGTFKKSAIVKVWNAFFDVEDGYGAKLYYPGAGLPLGYTYIKHLTTQPQKMLLDINSISWLWFFTNKDVQTYDFLQVRVDWSTYTAGAGFTSGSVYVTLDGVTGTDGIVCMNSSPMWVVDNTPADPGNLVYYALTVMGNNGGVRTQYVETMEFIVERFCEPVTDAYFLTPLGGHGTMVVKVIDRDANQDYTEILLDTPCVATREEKGKYRGRSLSNVRSYESITIQAEYDWSEEWVNYFRDFKTSPQRWVRVTGNDGTYIARKFNVGTGGIKIYTNGEKIRLTATGSFQDIPIQSNTEPIIS